MPSSSAELGARIEEPRLCRLPRKKIVKTGCFLYTVHQKFVLVRRRPKVPNISNARE